MLVAIISDTHLPRGGRRLPDPGSPTERRRSPAHTMGLARVGDGRIAFELVTLD